MTPNTYSVTAKDGSVHTRNSKRSYTHAIVGTWGEATNWNYTVWAWCGSYELAINKLKILKKQKWNNAEAILQIVAVVAN